MEKKFAGSEKEKALSTVAVEFQTVFETAKYGIAILDAKTRKITDTNPFLLETLDLEKEFCLGKELWEIGLTENASECHYFLNELFHENFFSYQTIKTHACGKKISSFNLIGTLHSAGGSDLIICNLYVSGTTDIKAESPVFRCANYLSLIEPSPCPIFIADFEGNIGFVNHSAAKLFDAEVVDLVGENIRRLLSARTNETLELANAQERTKVEIPVEWEFLQKSGKIIYGRVFRQILSDNCWQAFVFDINKSKQTSKENKRLLNNLKDLKFALDEAAIVATTDARGRITYVNDKFCEISKYSREELIGKDHRIVNSGHHDREFINNLWRTIKSGKVWKGEICNRAKDGSTYWVDTTIVPFVDEQGEPYQFTAIRSDITKRKQAEETLEKSEEKFRATFDHAAVGMAHVAPDGSFLNVNEKLCEITGYQREELLRIRFQDITYYDDLSTDVQQVKRMLEGEIKTYSMEKRYIKKNGEQVWVNLTVALICKDDGKPDYFISVIEDIDARKKAEDVAYRWNQVFQKAKFGVAYADPSDNTFLDVNRSFAEQRGYTREELIGKPLLTVYAPESREEMKRRIGLIDELGHIVYESIHQRKDGSTFPVLMEVTSVKDKNGKPISRLAYALDISDRKRAEEELKLSEERYRQILESLPQLIWTCGADGKCDYLSRQWIEYTGKSEKEQLGFGWLKQVHPQDRGAVKQAWRESLVNDTNLQIEFRVRRYDGVYRWFHTRAVRLLDKDGDTVKFFGTNTDIEELKRTEQELKLEKERLGNIAAIAPGAIHTFRLNREMKGSFPFISAASMEIYGIPPEELREDGSKALELTHPDDLQEMLESVQKSLDNMQPWRHEFRLYHPTKGLIWIEANSTPVKEPDGSVLWHGFLTDITERKKIEESIMRMNETLEQRVAERTVALEAVNRELESFAYSVSHDLRAPLRALNGFSLALMEDYADELDDTSRHYLERIHAASQNMAQLIDDLLKLSRVTRGELYRSDFDLTKIVEEITADLCAAHPDRRVNIEIEKGLIANGDTRLIRIALGNLLGNAWKFTSKRENAEIRFGCRRENGKRVYFVADNGAGFDPRYADKLFGAFQRLHSTNEFEGTGIGLATVQRILHRHGGEIYAESTPDRGATFYFTI